MVVLGNPTGLGSAAVARAMSPPVCLGHPFLQDMWQLRPSCTGGGLGDRIPQGSLWCCEADLKPEIKDFLLVWQC